MGVVNGLESKEEGEFLFSLNLKKNKLRIARNSNGNTGECSIEKRYMDVVECMGLSQEEAKKIFSDLFNDLSELELSYDDLK